jgi:GxxExxY protein
MGAGQLGRLLHGEITEKIFAAAFEVHTQLGPGFLESVYEEALAVELSNRQLSFNRQVEVPIYYKATRIGTHRLDLVVGGQVIVELKTVQELAEIHTAIALSYLKATSLSVALLLNFARPSLEYKRVTRTPHPKPSA